MDREYLTKQCKTCPRWGRWQGSLVTSAGRASCSPAGCQYTFPSNHCKYARKIMEAEGENIMISPEEFAERMKTLSLLDDIEVRHAAMDELMCHVLIGLGYGDGVEIYNDTYMEYA